VAVVARYLVDTSAAARFHHADVSRRLTPLIEAGLVATCAPLDFEALYSTRGPADYEAARTDRALAYEYLPTDDLDWRRALEVQRELAHTSWHRAVGIADLLVAAVAQRHGVTVVHYDADFDTIAGVTGQETQWVVERGAVL
jgi:predicted nucleic acid-binding protein